MSVNEDNDPSKHMCRACLQSVEALRLFNLFQAWSPEWEGMENTIAEDLAKLANVQISETDKHSKYICGSCCEKLQVASNFVSSVQKNDRLMKERLLQCEGDISLDKSWPKPIQIDKNITCDNGLDVDIKQEVLSDEEYNCNTEEGRETDYVEVKVEPEEIVEPTPIKISVNGSSLNEFTENPFENGEDSMPNGEVNYEGELSDTQIKEEPGSDTEDTELGPIDLPLECMLCTRVFSSMSGLKAHVIAQHSYKSVKRKAGDSSPRKPPKTRYPCTICKRTFTTSTDLMVHETCHNKDVCYGCNAKFDSFDLLAEHTQRCKAFSSAEVKKPRMLDDVIRPKSVTSTSSSEDIKSDDITESLTCNLCSEVFSDSYYLKIHQEVHHTNENIIVKLEKENDPAPMEIEMLESIFNENT